MRKLGNKGFAISGIVYTVFLMFITILTVILMLLLNRKIVLDKEKKDLLNKINTENTNYEIHYDYRNISVVNKNELDKINVGGNIKFEFDPLEGVYLVNKKTGDKITSDIEYTSTPDLNLSNNGVYELTYKTNHNGNEISSKRIIKVESPIVYTYGYEGLESSFTASDNGIYNIQLWGASGNKGTGATGGGGAYVTGNIDLYANEKIYFYVGQGNLASGNSTSYNGGTANQNGWPGGGATDVRLTNGYWNNFNGLKSRIMVAAGSGSANGASAVSGAGGTLNGINGGGTKGASQIAASAAQNTAYGISGFGYANGGCSGGNGYYGAAGANCASGGGGGSSFVSGYPGCNSISESSQQSNIIHTGNNIHYSNKKFTDSVMIAGNSNMPNYSGTGSINGNFGNGYAKVIKLISILSDDYVADTLIKNGVVTSGDGLYKDINIENSYIYKGANPNNYFVFDNKCFSVIGINSDRSVKLIYEGQSSNNNCSGIRTANSGDFVKDVPWNGVMYNNSDSWYDEKSSDSLRKQLTTIASEDKFITKENQKYLINYSWNVGAVNDSEGQTLATDLAQERNFKGNTLLPSLPVTFKDKKYHSYKWENLIGTINLTDFVKASTNSACVSVNSAKKDPFPCKTGNYMVKDYSTHTLSGYGNGGVNSWHVTAGIISAADASRTRVIRPVVVLSANVKVNGKGTADEPYILK